MTQPIRREPPVQFRDQRLSALLDQRGENRNLTAARDLDRYYDLLLRLEGRLEALFTAEELDLISRMLQGVFVGDTAAPYLIDTEVADDPETVMAVLGSRGPAFLERLKTLHPAEKLALTDLVERRNRRGYDHDIA